MQTLSADHDQELSRNVKWSLIIHLALFTVLIVKSLIFPSDPIKYAPALRVDIVGLPDVLKKDEAILKPRPSAQEAAQPREDVKDIAEKEEMVLKPKQATKEEKRKDKLNSALARIKALNKVSELEEKESETNLYKGNIISKGSTRTGDAKESDSPAYYDSVLERVRSHWSLPIWLSRQNLTAQVVIFIDGRGTVRSFNFVKASGNSQFDQYVKQAITDSQPFDPPPLELRGPVLTNGILLGFPL